MNSTSAFPARVHRAERSPVGKDRVMPAEPATRVNLDRSVGIWTPTPEAVPARSDLTAGYRA